MSTTRDNRNATTNVARLAASILFVMIVAMGYAISPKVEGAVDSPVAAEQDIMEPAFLPSDCAIDGLVFADCNLEF